MYECIVCVHNRLNVVHDLQVVTTVGLLNCCYAGAIIPKWAVARCILTMAPKTLVTFTMWVSANKFKEGRAWSSNTT